MAEGIFKPLDADIVRTAIFGMCFLLTMLSQEKGHTAIAAITRQLQVLAGTGLLAP